MDRERQIVLGGLLVVLAVLTALVLSAVLRTVVFAITVASVLYPIRRWFSRRGLPDRIASGLATAVGFLVVLVVAFPLVVAVYDRREQFVDLLQSLPETLQVGVGGTAIAVDTGPVVDEVIASVRHEVVDLAVAIPSFALHLALFTLLLYGLLYKPGQLRKATLALVPARYHDVVFRLHDRASSTLFALYVLQFLTAIATFVIALVVFWLLGYDAALTLATIAAIFQFVPILGPSLLVVALAVGDLLTGDPTRGFLVLVLGLLFVALTPDAVVRTKLAGYTGKISPSLYFVGFVGGILTIGALGIIVGPLVVALLVETVQLLSDRADTAVEEAEPTPEQPAD